MKEEDIEAVLEISREASLSPWTFEGYLSEIKRVDSIMLTAETNSEIVGFIVARLITQLDVKGEVEIYNIAVRKDLRRAGIGKKLLQAVLAEVGGKISGHVWLEVRRSNVSARKFYEANGFKVFGERKNFYTNPLEDAILMCAEF